MTQTQSYNGPRSIPLFYIFSSFFVGYRALFPGIVLGALLVYGENVFLHGYRVPSQWILITIPAFVLFVHVGITLARLWLLAYGTLVSAQVGYRTKRSPTTGTYSYLMRSTYIDHTGKEHIHRGLTAYGKKSSAAWIQQSPYIVYHPRFPQYGINPGELFLPLSFDLNGNITLPTQKDVIELLKWMMPLAICVLITAVSTVLMWMPW